MNLPWSRGAATSQQVASPCGLSPPATLETMGFALQSWPTQCADFRDEAAVVETYYEEMMELVKKKIADADDLDTDEEEFAQLYDL